jgi:hypothetical protein
MDQVQLHLVGGGDLLQFAVAGPDGLYVEADFLEERFDRPDVAADIVIADQGDVIGGFGFGELAGSDDMVANGIVGDWCPSDWDTAKTFAVARDNRDIQFSEIVWPLVMSSPMGRPDIRKGPNTLDRRDALWPR